ncbi:MAG TPA: hypothetical protein VKA32_01190 [Gammaproteobacteria bacterium]|nr:hypothetical protein [Gammaproteobacteria bacterium]
MGQVIRFPVERVKASRTEDAAPLAAVSPMLPLITAVQLWSCTVGAVLGLFTLDTGDTVRPSGEGPATTAAGTVHPHKRR